MFARYFHAFYSKKQENLPAPLRLCAGHLGCGCAALIISAILWAGCVTNSQSSPSTASQTRVVVAQDSRFVAYSDGTVLDMATGLMWAAKDNGNPITWDEAKSYCANYRAGGYTNWRMPTLDELTALYDPKVSNNTPPAAGCEGGCHLTRFIHLNCCPVWWWNGLDEVPGFFHFRLGPSDWSDDSLSTFHPRALPVRNMQ